MHKDTVPVSITDIIPTDDNWSKYSALHDSFLEELSYKNQKSFSTDIWLLNYIQIFFTPLYREALPHNHPAALLSLQVCPRIANNPDAPKEYDGESSSLFLRKASSPEWKDSFNRKNTCGMNALFTFHPANMLPYLPPAAALRPPNG